MSERLSRDDAFPEGMEYIDTGCEYHPSCLTCPFAVCRYDLAQGLRTLQILAQAKEAVRMRSGGATVDECARLLGVHPRTVYRMLEKVKNG